MTPYYSDDHVTLYHGNCLDPDFAEVWCAADVLVTDPPYGMAFVSGQKKQTAEERAARVIAGDATPEVRDKALDLWADVTIDGAEAPLRPAAVFGTWRVPQPSYPVTQLLIWHKKGAGPGMGNLDTAFGTAHEDIYLLGEWPRTARRRGSVLTTETSPSGYTTKIGHPTPKPVGLMEILVESAPPGVIADPFAGSGSTLLAARNLGRRAIGVELEEKYCELIASRLDQGVLDLGIG